MESNTAKLRRKYPTLESIEIDAEAAGSKVNLARELGLSKQCLADYARGLRCGPQIRIRGPRKNNCDLTDGETDARIKEMYGGRYENVKVYKLTDGYIPGQMGTEGLEFIRTETSRTALSLWSRGGK